MYTNTFKILKKAFQNELNREGDIWRILRKDTLIDLIKLDFILFSKEHKEKYLINIFNYSMKALLIDRINPINVSDNINTITNEFNLNNSLILNTYDIIFSEINDIIKDYISADVHDLNDKIQYIKVGNNLNISLNLDDLFIEIMAITLVVLMKR